MKKISNLLMMALLTIGMGLTSCDEQLDNAVNPGVMPDVDDVTPTVEEVIKYGFKVTDLNGADLTGDVTSLKMSKAAAGAPAFCTMNEGERCVFFEAPASWGSQINVWAWMNGGDGKDYLGTGWPGVTATKLGTADNGNSVWKWNVSGSVNPDNIIFSGGSEQTADLKFTNGGYYGEEGLKATVTPEYEAEVSGGKITIKAENLSGITAAADFWFEAEIGGKPYVAKVNIDPKTLSPETPMTLAMATIGDVILSDGKFAARSSTTGTIVAMIAYLGSSTGVAGKAHAGYTHGLALALDDEGALNWSTATGASGAAAHYPNAPTSVTSSWMLPGRDQWNKMITAAGGYDALRDGFSGIAGASNLKSDRYWSITKYNAYNARYYDFGSGYWGFDSEGYVYQVRACLAF